MQLFFRRVNHSGIHVPFMRDAGFENLLIFHCLELFAIVGSEMLFIVFVETGRNFDLGKFRYDNRSPNQPVVYAGQSQGSLSVLVDRDFRSFRVFFLFCVSRKIKFSLLPHLTFNFNSLIFFVFMLKIDPNQYRNRSFTDTPSPNGKSGIYRARESLFYKFGRKYTLVVY